MRNKSNPLAEAMGHKATPPSIDFKDVPSRQIEIHHSEIPGLPGRHVGEHITVSLQGHIASHEDGHSVLEVHHVAPDSPTEESFGTKEAIRVIPPNSPAPS